CNPSGECKPYPAFQKINPSSQLQIRGNCETGCENVNSIAYSYQIFRKLSKPTVDNAWIPFWMPHLPSNASTSSNGVIYLNKSHVLGSDANQMVMLAELFKLDETAVDWKIDLTVTTITNSGISMGSSSLRLKKNKLPQAGKCTVSPTEGLAMTTFFKIICTGWQDLDGKIVRYEYYSIYRGIDQPVSLGFDSVGQIEFELPLGPAFDNYKMYLYVEVIDNDDGSTRFNLDTPGLSSSLNGYSTDLDKDLSDAAVPDDDNDIENFWNNPRNLDSDPSIANLDPIAKMPNSVFQGFSKINLPNFCDMIAQDPINETNSSSNPLYTPPKNPNSCDTKTVVLRTRNEPIAPTGTNGANETKIEDSNTVSLEFLDENSNQIGITESRNPIDIWIPRNPTLIVEFTNVDVANLSLPMNASFLPNGITVDAVNISLFIQIRPELLDIGYFVWYKIGLTPGVDDTSVGFCPENIKTVRGETYYQMSINQSEIDGFKGFIGFGIREMNTEEFEFYCTGNSSSPMVPLYRNMTNFTSDFSLRIFSSACYFYDRENGKWNSDGVQIMDDSNIHYTHCKSKHLTTFAGGFIVLPPAINFEKVFANASFADNPTIYITVIVISSLFIALMIIARYMDIQDSKKLGLNLLPDNNPYHDYCYEIMVFTGSRREAGTDSQVRFILSGEDLDTGVRVLSDPRRKVFRRSAIDSFIMAVEQPLGALNYLRIWHDNSGDGDYASWYLKFVIIRDLQTKEKAYFLCEKWLAVEKDDGKIDRLLSIATEVQKTNLQYLAQKETKKKIQDEHLWLSILSRPIQSAFTRMDRVTCCFVLLYVTMLMNILYYGVDTSSNPSGLEIGPFMLTPTQIGIGIITNIITFPPTLLLVYLFRNSKKRTTPLRKLEKMMTKNQNKEEIKFDNLQTSKSPVPELKSKKKSKGLPWWCKIIAYVLSAIFMGVSIFFIIIQGINLGDEKVKKWLTSFVTSILSSILLTQPIKIVLTAMVVILICRKSNDVSDIQHDADEDDSTYENKRNLNKDQRFDQYRDFGISDTGKLNSNEIDEARKKRETEVKFWKMVKEVTAYFVFLMLLFTFSYSTRASNSYFYKAHMEKFILGEEFEKVRKFQILL
ncbi:polycystic kidney disease 1-like 2, partial [Brachionus plicatilis]